jgi:hypothetical protein
MIEPFYCLTYAVKLLHVIALVYIEDEAGEIRSLAILIDYIRLKGSLGCSFLKFGKCNIKPFEYIIAALCQISVAVCFCP